MPIVVVTAEASWMAADNHGMVDYLVQAGASAEHLRSRTTASTATATP